MIDFSQSREELNNGVDVSSKNESVELLVHSGRYEFT